MALVPALTDGAREEVTFDDVAGLAASFLDSYLYLTTTGPELEAHASLARRCIYQSWSDK